MNDIIFTVPGVPQGKGRPRVTRNGAFTPKKTRDYEKKVRDCYIAQGGQMFPDDTPLFASITAIFPIPSSLSKKRRALFNGKRHCKKPDADNVAKAILDALNGVAYRDDSAVSSLIVGKSYGDDARVIVILADAANEKAVTSE